MGGVKEEHMSGGHGTAGGEVVGHPSGKQEVCERLRLNAVILGKRLKTQFNSLQKAIEEYHSLKGVELKSTKQEDIRWICFQI